MAWYAGAWQYRVKVTIAASQVASALTEYPVYISLASLPAGFHSNVKSDGGDIRVTAADGETELAREVVAYDAGADTGEVHFKAPSLSAVADNEFYIYYGNAAASDYAVDATFGAENVWDADFLRVSHDGGATDSTGNGHGGTATDVVAGSGQIGAASVFNGTSSEIALGDISAAFSDEAQISAWVKLDLYPPASSGQTGIWVLRSGSSRSHYTWTNGNAYWSTFRTFRIGNITLPGVDPTDWHRILIQTTPGTDGWKFSQNQTLVREETGDDVAGVGDDSSIGDSGGSEHFDGMMDEVRISTVARSADWNDTEYANQNDPSTFYSVGAQEEDGAGAGLVRVVAEAMAAADQMSLLLALTRLRSEAEGLSEAAARPRARARRRVETEGIADAGVVARILARTRAEALSLTESTATVLEQIAEALLRAVSETVAVADAVLRPRRLARARAELVAMAGAVARVGGLVSAAVPVITSRIRMRVKPSTRMNVPPARR